MCGIAVAIGLEGAERTVADLLAGIHHRGAVTDPIVSPGARMAMGTRRLPIVDAAHGAQPQASFDGRMVVSFNGEIYNHAALRDELSRMGVPFRTSSDTEVLANALRVWGAGALARLSGMYAFVAVEVDTGEFIAARDPFGVKPLYLIANPGSYVFCSEVRPLLDAIDTGDVLLIPPGHLLMRRAFTAFASPIQPEPDIARTGSPRALDALLSAAVARRMDTELPVACLFSGGIDSTLIAHYGRQVRPDMPGYFLGDARAPDYAYAAEYAERTGFDLRLTPLDDRIAGDADLMRRVVQTVETFEPEVVRTSVCSYLLCERVRRDGFDIAICGEAADELFAGYVQLEAAFDHSEALGRDLRRQCLSSMHSTNLQRVDRCGMAFTVEVREPFLDPEVVNYALALPGEELVRRGVAGLYGKLPLRQIYDLHPRALPQSIRDRRKAAFNEGAGFDRSHDDSPWLDAAETAVSDRDWRDGVKAFADFGVRTKEEIMYMRHLASALDVTRLPYLRTRNRLIVPADFAEARMQAYTV